MSTEPKAKRSPRCRCTLMMRLVDGEWRCPAHCPRVYSNRVDHRTSRARTLGSRSRAGQPAVSK
jgi:hypothetical protein